MAVARLRGKPPSELLRVGCEWCAYCLDESLLVREAREAKRQAAEAEAEQNGQPSPAATDRVLQRMKADGVIQ
jgi:hypothetical protein